MFMLPDDLSGPDLHACRCRLALVTVQSSATVVGKWTLHEEMGKSPAETTGLGMMACASGSDIYSLQIL